MLCNSIIFGQLKVRTALNDIEGGSLILKYTLQKITIVLARIVIKQSYKISNWRQVRTNFVNMDSRYRIPELQQII